MNTVHYVVVFVLRPTPRGYELLLGRRAEGRYMGGTWQLITGAIEPNETAWQAALREVAEETGLVVGTLYRLPENVTQFYRPDIDALCVGVVFCATVAADARVTINPEHTHLEWTPLDTAAARLMWPGDHAALAHVRSQIVDDGPAKPYLRVDIHNRS